jgi:Arc/MetJ-type ribon-helix-helix transcriptional regulator
MIIHLPKDVESSICAGVQSGEFASVDEAITAAWRAYQRQRNQGQAVPDKPGASQEILGNAQKPIWKEIEEIIASVPEEEFLKLPVDGAEQHDHYIYGTPKRSPAK